MSVLAFLAVLYTALAALPTVMHLALAAGAPLGRYTMGGLHSGRLPIAFRGLAIVQAMLLFGMCLVVLDQAGIILLGTPKVLIWAVLGITILSFIANAISPSRAERLLWTPVLAGMSAALISMILI